MGDTMKALIAILVTLSMAGVDFCHARYTYEILNRRIYRAGFWSVGQWGCASIGFVFAVKYSMWYLPFEAVGLFAGTILAGHRLKRYDQNLVQPTSGQQTANLPRRNQDQMPGLSKNSCCGSCHDRP